MRVLTLTTLYPNAAQPFLGLFVERRLRHLVATGRVSATVVAPVPWFPSRAGMFGRYATLARVPSRENNHGIEVLHPRFLAMPKVGTAVAPWLLAAGLVGPVGRLWRDGVFDVIDAHYFYPDGVAAAVLARWFGCPLVITARGTDVNLLTQFRLPRAAIRWAAARAVTVVAVSEALRDRLIAIGVPAARIRVLRNGVDLDAFRPSNPTTAWPGTGLPGNVLLAVGNLVELKGHHLIVAALAGLPDCSLVIVGQGGQQAELERLVGRLGLGSRVRIVPPVEQAVLAEYYSRASALVLGSSREGMPNVVLEALACDTPVVATNVGGAGEILRGSGAGVLVAERTAEGIAAGVRRLLANYPVRGTMRSLAGQFDWQSTTAGQLDIFEHAITKPRRSAGAGRGD